MALAQLKKQCSYLRVCLETFSDSISKLNIENLSVAESTAFIETLEVDIKEAKDCYFEICHLETEVNISEEYSITLAELKGKFQGKLSNWRAILLKLKTKRAQLIETATPPI